MVAIPKPSENLASTTASTTATTNKTKSNNNNNNNNNTMNDDDTTTATILSNEDDNNNNDVIPESQRVSLSILSDVTTAQSTHGLKHGDYDRYRKYCTRRLSRVRTCTNLTNRHGPVNSHKYQARQITCDDVIRDSRSLFIPLILSERDWSFAMAIKHDTSRPKSRARRCIHAHLQRAVFHSTNLSLLSRHSANEQTMLEAEAYAQGMRAVLALEKESWSSALTAYEIASKIYTGMAGVRTGTSSATLYERKVEEISHAIRLCKYHLDRSGQTYHHHHQNQDVLLKELQSESTATRVGNGASGISDVLSSKIEAALAEARKRAAQSFGHVSWCGVDVSLRSERVREAVLKFEQENELFLSNKQKNDNDQSNLNNNNSRVEEYDKLFVVMNDAIKVVSDELKQFRTSSGTSDNRVEELELIVAYLTYNRLQRTIDRNLILIDSLSTSTLTTTTTTTKKSHTAKPEDYVRMYDNLITNVSDILSLKGVDVDAAFVNDNNSRKRLFQACRCFHLAQSYQDAQLAAEAAALFDRVAVHASAIPTSSVYAEEARRVVKESRGMKCRARAQVFLDEMDVISKLNGVHLDHDHDEKTNVHNSKTTNNTMKSKTMLEHMDEFTSFVPVVINTNADETMDLGKAVAICQVPPPLQAVPCKPVLFDLAIDGVRLRGEDKNEEEEEEEAKEVKETETNQKGQTEKGTVEKKSTEDKTAENSGSYASSVFAGTRLGRWWSGSSS